jgi:hypothetical protein
VLKVLMALMVLMVLMGNAIVPCGERAALHIQTRGVGTRGEGDCNHLGHLMCILHSSLRPEARCPLAPTEVDLVGCSGHRDLDAMGFSWSSYRQHELVRFGRGPPPLASCGSAA